MADWGKIRRASWISFAAAAAMLAVEVAGSGAEARTERAANGAWVAYATAPAAAASRRFRYQGGSDVFIVQPGRTPKLVAGRGNGSIWNLCPAFSPNGKLLAFGQKSPGGSVDQSRRRVAGRDDHRRPGGSKVRGETALCPRWSADGKRIAFLDSSRDLVVISIDGATRHGAPSTRRSRSFREPTRPSSRLTAPWSLAVRLTRLATWPCRAGTAQSDGSWTTSHAATRSQDGLPTVGSCW